MLYQLILVILLSFTSATYALQSFNAPTQNFYVSPRGSDANEGSLEKPLATFEAARDKVRSFKKSNPGVPITVYFRAGKYYLPEPVVFKAKDTGRITC